jgi:hypothetical protein
MTHKAESVVADHRSVGSEVDNNAKARNDLASKVEISFRTSTVEPTSSRDEILDAM